jgi:hypothetical protein
VFEQQKTVFRQWATVFWQWVTMFEQWKKKWSKKKCLFTIFCTLVKLRNLKYIGTISWPYSRDTYYMVTISGQEIYAWVCLAILWPYSRHISTRLMRYYFFFINSARNGMRQPFFSFMRNSMPNLLDISILYSCHIVHMYNHEQKCPSIC